MSDTAWSPAVGPQWLFTPVFFEVTNTLTVPYVTGLQRLTREVARHLGSGEASAPLRMIPIVWCPRLRDYRRLTSGERHKLTNGSRSATSTTHAPSAARSIGDRLPDSIADQLRRISRSPRVQRIRRAIANRRRPRAAPQPELEALRLDVWPSNGWLLDIEAVWHDPVPRRRLLPLLAQIGVRSVPVIADVMPEMHPAWFDTGSATRFGDWLRAHLAHSDHFICISRRTESDLQRFASTIGIDVGDRTSVIDLGADFPANDDPANDDPANDDPATGNSAPSASSRPRRLLVVGTIEPRKNQGLALDVFDRLCPTHPELHLSLVGKQGWLVDDLIRRITTHPLFGERLRWESDLDDNDLAERYRTAFLALVPSRYEGFGAPVVEGLARGVPTIASTGGALPEAGGDWCEYAGPDDVDTWVRLVERHLDDDAHHQAAVERVATYPQPSWATTADQILAILTALAI